MYLHALQLGATYHFPLVHGWQALLWAAYCDQFVPEAYGFGAAASVVCYIPFLCNIVAWLTAGPADYATLYNGMTKKHKNLFILPGGVAEVCGRKKNKQPYCAESL